MSSLSYQDTAVRMSHSMYHYMYLATLYRLTQSLLALPQQTQTLNQCLMLSQHQELRLIFTKLGITYTVADFNNGMSKYRTKKYSKFKYCIPH